MSLTDKMMEAVNTTTSTEINKKYTSIVPVTVESDGKDTTDIRNYTKHLILVNLIKQVTNKLKSGDTKFITMCKKYLNLYDEDDDYHQIEFEVVEGDFKIEKNESCPLMRRIKFARDRSIETTLPVTIEILGYQTGLLRIALDFGSGQQRTQFVATHHSNTKYWQMFILETYIFIDTTELSKQAWIFLSSLIKINSIWKDRIDSVFESGSAHHTW